MVNNIKHALMIPFLIVFLAVITFPLDAVAREPFGIINYSPTSFIELADEPFFYSIGDTLRYGRTINNSLPVVFNGDDYAVPQIISPDEWPPLTIDKNYRMDVYVSPDNKKAAVFYGDNLYLTTTTGPAFLLLSDCKRSYLGGNNNLERGKYYRDLQWDAESKFIYMIRDKTNRTYRPDNDPVLVRIDTVSPNKIVEVLKDFKSFFYFFIGNNTVCYDHSLGEHMVWRCSHNGNISGVKSHNDGKIVLDNGFVINGRPFLSYRYPNNNELWLSYYGFSMKREDGKVTDFFSKSEIKKPLFKIQGVYNIKGRYCIGISRQGCVLPGGRYALLDVWHDNFKGQLLVDGETGKYRELPAKTIVYLNINSLNYKYFKFDIRPGKQPEFVPAAHIPFL